MCDPYIIHKRPTVPEGKVRTFVRVSHVPIEIPDVNNTQNPLMPKNYDRDGVKEFRDSLVDYWEEELDDGNRRTYCG